MKRLTSISYSQATLNMWSLILRVAIGVMMLTHGFPKFQKLIAGGEIQFADPFGMGTYLSFALVVFAEFFCAILLIFGLFTRLATIPLMITMLVAIFYAHANDPFGKKEMAVLYLISLITIAVIGPGSFSIDGSFNKRTRR